MAATAYDIIKRPVITEQSMAETEAKKYTFEVAKDANKIEIAKAVEELRREGGQGEHPEHAGQGQAHGPQPPPAAGPAGRRPWSP